MEKSVDATSTSNKGPQDKDSSPSGYVPSSESTKAMAGYWWHVNKSGFPISGETWSKMWQHISDVHPEASQISASIRGKNLKWIPIPPCPLVNPSYSAHQNLLAIQNYMNELQYNHTGTQFFDVKKYRPLSRYVIANFKKQLG